MILPRADAVVIPKEKFLFYALDLRREGNKAFAFSKALGYTKVNVDELIENIRRNVVNFPAEFVEKSAYGDKYCVKMVLTGANGKQAKVLTAWIDDAVLEQTRLTSAYVDK